MQLKADRFWPEEGYVMALGHLSIKYISFQKDALKDVIIRQVELQNNKVWFIANSCFNILVVIGEAYEIYNLRTKRWLQYRKNQSHPYILQGIWLCHCLVEKKAKNFLKHKCSDQDCLSFIISGTGNRYYLE